MNEKETFKPEYLKTHKVIDMVYHEDEHNEVFVGTRQECEDWKSNQGFGYKILPLTLAEIEAHNQSNV